MARHDLIEERLTHSAIGAFFDVYKQRLDMVVDGKLIIEIKATPDLPKTATRQLYNYLRVTALRVGLLFHFGSEPKFYRLVGPRQADITNGDSRNG